MILNKLYIDEDSEIEFHEGLNIILGRNYSSSPETKSTRDTNGIGKSTIVNAVKAMVGGSTEGAFKSSYFEENLIWGHLEVTDREGKDYVFAFHLSDKFRSKFKVVFHGDLENFQERYKSEDYSEIVSKAAAKKYFKSDDVEVLTKDEFKAFVSKINKIDYSDVNLKLSSLMDYISRDEKLGFGDVVSRQGRTQWVQYRAIQFLFGLNYKLEEKVSDLKSQKLSKEKELELYKEFLARLEVHNEDSIESKQFNYTEGLKEVRERIANLDLGKSIEETRLKYKSKKKKLTNINKELNYREKQVQNQEINLQSLESNTKSLNDLLKADDFLKDVLDVFPEVLSENIAEYKNFFNSITPDRKKYHESLIRKLGKKIEALNEDKSLVQAELNELSTLMNSTNIAVDVSVLTGEESELLRKLDDLKEARRRFKACEVLEDEIDDLDSDIGDLLKDAKKSDRSTPVRTKKSEMIKSYLNMVYECYGNREGVLEFSLMDNTSAANVGRTEVACSLSSDASHGRSNAKICLFDFVWFLRDRLDNEFDPRFLIHDGVHAKISPDVKYKMLKMIDKLTCDSGKQYIMTANENEIPKLEEFEDKIAIELDGSCETGKFLGKQYE